MFMAKYSTKICPTFIFFYFPLPSSKLLQTVERNSLLNYSQLLYTVTITMHYAACHHLPTVSLMAKV